MCQKFLPIWDISLFVQKFFGLFGVFVKKIIQSLNIVQLFSTMILGMAHETLYCSGYKEFHNSFCQLKPKDPLTLHGGIYSIVQGVKICIQLYGVINNCFPKNNFFLPVVLEHPSLRSIKSHFCINVFEIRILKYITLFFLLFLSLLLFFFTNKNVSYISIDIFEPKKSG